MSELGDVIALMLASVSLAERALHHPQAATKVLEKY